ncbi:arginine/serine-rich protein PNISR [Pectinophora gossypiella]|nr:arginine/serine-rich protein PNISR [Pectinophora gossypiella]XP_049872720.1 arginine/serine-rich protein PNISR [Pectinophora gossypiella]
MFSGKDAAANPAYPTQWALNPTAYQNVDSSTVDWAALAQQWIAMKEAAAILAAPPAPSMKPDAEEGEAPMEVENPDNNSEPVEPPPGAEWDAATNSWGSAGWNQWGWGWGAGGVDSKMGADPGMAMGPMMDGYTPDGTAPMPGYTTGSTPTFQHGYWTAPQADQQNNSRESSRGRDRRSKSKNRDHKASRSRTHRDKGPVLPPVIEPIVMPTPPPPTLDAAKRRQLPAWIREGLEKMEREKQRAIERQQEKQAREAAEKEKKRLEEEELERLKAEADGQPMVPAKSKFDSDSESESEKEEVTAPPPPQLDREQSPQSEKEEPLLAKKTKEEILQEMMMTVRRSLTEILLEVTDSEIQTVSQEELARYTAAQASRLNAMKASKSKALAAIASGLGLGAYESSSEDSGGEDEQNDVSDQQLQDIIKRKKFEFERTSRDIEAEVRRAELRDAGDPEPQHTPERPRRTWSSATPPPVESDTPEKIPERRLSKDKKNYKSSDKIDSFRKLDTIQEEKSKKYNKKEHTPSPQKNNHKKESSPSTSDSEADSLTSSSESSESEPDTKVDAKAKKRKRKSSDSGDSHRKAKKEKHKKDKSHKSDEKSSSKSKHYDDYEKSRSKKKDDYYDRHKSSRSRDYEKSHKDKYRDDSDEDRPRKRSKRSRSISYESRSGRRRSSRDRSSERSRRRDRRSYDRDSSKRERSRERSWRDHDKYDRYERSRDYDRRRSSSGSRTRHRR